MNPITPCLWFDRQAEDAAACYVATFPDSEITSLTHYPEDAEERAGEVLPVEFRINGQPFTALNGGPQFSLSEAVSFQVVCADQNEVDDYWAKLTAAGGEEGPCGWCKDRFGLSWQIVPTDFVAMLNDPDRRKVAAAMQAMHQMKKLDLAALQRAFDTA